MMKTKATISNTLLAIALSGCQFRSGKQDGSYAAFNLGIREKGVVQTPGGYIADEASGVESFQNLTSFAKTLAYMDALKGVTRSLSGAYSDVVKTREAAGVSKHAATADVQKAAIEADVIKSTTPAQ